MNRFTDAALLRGEYAEMLKNPPKDSEWKNTSCENRAEAVSQEIAKHIFSMQKGIDPDTHHLEVFTYSAKGAMKVLQIMPGEADLIRIDGVIPQANIPVSVVHHARQLSLTFCVEETKVGEAENEENEGMKIGFVIFDELSRRKKSRDAAQKKRRKSATSRKKGSR